MTGNEIREARERAGLTQDALGSAVGVSGRTVGNWERGTTVPRNRLAKLREVLEMTTTPADATPLRDVSDASLLAEIARRFDAGRARKEEGEDNASTPLTRAAGSAADNVAPFVADKKQQRAEHTPHPELLAAYEAGETEKERQDREAEKAGEEDQSSPYDE